MKTKTIIYILVGVVIVSIIIYFIVKANKKSTSTSTLSIRRLGGAVINPSEPRPNPGIVPSMPLVNPIVERPLYNSGCASLQQQINKAWNNVLSTWNTYFNDSACFNNTFGQWNPTKVQTEYQQGHNILFIISINSNAPIGCSSKANAYSNAISQWKNLKDQFNSMGCDSTKKTFYVR